jgi:hypothetical protein
MCWERRQPEVSHGGRSKKPTPTRAAVPVRSRGLASVVRVLQVGNAAECREVVPGLLHLILVS